MNDTMIFTEPVDATRADGEAGLIEVEAWSDNTIRLDSLSMTHDLDVEQATALMLALAAAIRAAQSA